MVEHLLRIPSASVINRDIKQQRRWCRVTTPLLDMGLSRMEMSCVAAALEGFVGHGAQKRAPASSAGLLPLLLRPKRNDNSLHPSRQ